MLQNSDEIFEDSGAVRKSSMCVACKGSKLLCGKRSCPILVRYYFQSATKPLTNTLTLEGSSPPSVFVGRIGYPKVYIGPLLPPTHGNTEILDTPELWLDKSIEEIVSFRSQLVRGMHRMNVHNVEAGGRNVEYTRELALCSVPADMEAEFSKKPRGRLVLDDSIQPMGPSAPLKRMELETLKVDRRIERAYQDDDLKAQNAVLELYSNNLSVTKIQRAFSVGAFGLRKKRKFVPTRWSITAVDDIIGKYLREKVKELQTIDEFRVYWSLRLDNRWIVLMMPYNWMYELIEAWYPETVWNPHKGGKIVIYHDSEGYEGRTTYANIGGCYYAARLAVGEHLLGEKRQAATVILREAHPGYILPVGVWNVRENVRNALRCGFKSFDALKDALYYISKRLAIPIKRWIKNSEILKDVLYQKRIEDFSRGFT